jgi:hypothetical protein
VQVETQIETQVETAWNLALETIKCDIVLSTSAFKFNLRRYTEGLPTPAPPPPAPAGRGLHSFTFSA